MVCQGKNPGLMERLTHRRISKRKCRVLQLKSNFKDERNLRLGVDYYKQLWIFRAIISPISEMVIMSLVVR